MSKSDKKLKEAIRETLSGGPQTALYTAMKRGRDQRAAAIAARPNGDAFRGETRAIKLDCQFIFVSSRLSQKSVIIAGLDPASVLNGAEGLYSNSSRIKFHSRQAKELCQPRIDI